jgi:hypothetical protein
MNFASLKTEIKIGRREGEGEKVQRLEIDCATSVVPLKIEMM